MTRVVLMTAALALIPVWSTAQPPMPPADAPPPASAAPASDVPPAAAIPPAPPLAVPLPPPAALGWMDLADLQQPWHFDFDLPAVPTELLQLDDLHIELSDLSDFRVDLQDLRTNLDRLAHDPAWRADLEALVSSTLAQANTASAAAEAAAAAMEARERSFEMQVQSGDAYNAGLDALQRRQYERAIVAFDRIIQADGPRSDAALYWKAFSEFKLARGDAARTTLARLQKAHPESRYASDARVLDAEVRKQAGQALDPSQLNDDDIKLLAIQGLQRSEQAVPLLEGVLNGANSLNVKRRALFVLALSSDSRARDILLRYATGAGNPDLQLEAVRLLVSRRDPQTTGAVLRDLYTRSPDTAIRRTVLDAYRAPTRTGSPDPSPLAASASQDLMALYRIESDADLRRHIASVLAWNGAVDQVVTLIRNEQDARTRTHLIRALNLRRNPQAGQALVTLYGAMPDSATRESIVSALADQQNAQALIELARAESNVQLRTQIVRHLSEMAPKSPIAADYLMEVIRE